MTKVVLHNDMIQQQNTISAVNTLLFLLWNWLLKSSKPERYSKRQIHIPSNFFISFKAIAWQSKLIDEKNLIENQK